MQKQVLQPGQGPFAPLGSTVSVHYTGKFMNGTVFDSSVSRGTPFTFRLGAGQVIAGWDQAVAGMQQGEVATFVIPPYLAYGGQSVGPIPPNSTLVFEIQLLGWN